MKSVRWNCGAKAGCRIPLGFYTKPCQENNHPKLLLFPASLSKCGSVTGRYVSQSHPGLNSIKESTKTYGSGASDMIRVLCTTTPPLWFIPSLIWSLAVTGLQAETTEPRRAPSGGLQYPQGAAPELISHNQQVISSLSLQWRQTAVTKHKICFFFF